MNISSFFFGVAAGSILIIVFTFIYRYLKTGPKKSREELILKNLQQAVLLVDRDGSIIESNRSAQDLLGYSETEFKNMKVEQLVPFRYRDQHVSYRNSFEKQPSERRMAPDRDLFALKKDGSEIPVEIGLNPALDSSKRYTVVTLTDITLRALARERDKNLRMDLFAKAIHAGIWDHDLQTDNQWWSDRFYEILGYKPGEIDSSSSFFFNNIIHPDDRLIYEREKQSHLDNNSPFQLEIRLKHSKAHYLYVFMSGYADRGANGVPLRMVGSIIDINDNVQMREQIKLKNRELQTSMDRIIHQKNRLMSFSQILSHNLKNHAANYTGLLSELKQPQNKQQDSEEILALLESVTDRFNRTVEDLTEVVRIQNDTNLQYELVDVHSSILETIKFIVNHDSEEWQGIEYDLDLSGLQCKEFRAESKYLTNILYSLLNNAFRYRKKDQKLHIKIFCTKNNDHIELRIQDNGTGIDLSENRENLFGMYINPNQKNRSRGMGLLMARNLMEAMNGSIYIESSTGTGTNIICRFPDRQEV